MTDAGPILFVDDEPHVRLAAQQTLELAGYQVVCTEDGALALGQLSESWPGVVVSDVRMPRMDGLELLERIVEIDAQIPVVLVTGHGDVTMAVQAMRAGAYDFLEKPYPSDQLVDVVRRAMEKRTLVLENRALRSAMSGGALEARIIGRTPAVEQLRQVVSTVAETDADALIFGETGTGKELVARCLHDLSRRRSRPYVAVNCGAMPETIIESELFGHEPGAFTGASRRRVGKLEHAQGGSFFLDEIESMPMSLQVKLLRVIQERTVERLGSNDQVALDLRFIAATKRDLLEASRAGEFREDLYYRLNVVIIEIPPLRERREDVPLLYQHFVERACARHGREPTTPSAATLSRLMAYAWPGNVRELQNVAERHALGLPGGMPGSAGPDCGRAEPGASTLAQQVDAFERCVIEQELRRRRGNVKETYEALGLPRKTFYDKMRRHGLSREEFV